MAKKTLVGFYILNKNNSYNPMSTRLFRNFYMWTNWSRNQDKRIQLLHCVIQKYARMQHECKPTFLIIVAFFWKQKPLFKVLFKPASSHVRNGIPLNFLFPFPGLSRFIYCVLDLRLRTFTFTYYCWYLLPLRKSLPPEISSLPHMAVMLLIPFREITDFYVVCYRYKC